MNPEYFIELWASAVANHLWQSTLFAAVVALLALTLRNYQARTRYWLWLAASTKFLIPFSLLLSLGSHLAWSVHSQISQPVIYSAIDQLSQPFSETTLPNASIIPATSHTSTILPAFLIALWLCGFIAVLAYWCIQLRRVSKSVREAKPLQSGREIEILRRLEHTANLRKPIELRKSPHSMEPGVVGILHPVLLWPEGISQHLDDTHLEAILAHEVCHVQRRDNFTSTIHMLVEALFWFHPLVWWLEKRLIDEREHACDEAVLQLGKQPQIYAESILKVCEFCIESPLTCVSGITGADLKKRIVHIMANRLGKNLGRNRKFLLATLGFAAVAGPVTFGVVHGIPLYGQLLHASGPLPSFEVATIKPSHGGASPMGSSGPPPDEWFFVGTTRLLIGYAYKLPPFSMTQISGGPGWINSNSYEVHGKIEPSLSAAMQKMPPAQRQDQRGLLVQSLLEQRFKLKVHFENREMSMYALVVAKGGPKLTAVEDVPNTAGTPPPSSPANLNGAHKGMLIHSKGPGFEMIGKGMTLDQITQLLHLQPEVGGRLIENQTGLSGVYDIKMQWTRESATPESETAPPPDADMPSYFTAIQEQLGLRLVPIKGQAEVVVIDHIELPSEN